MKYIVYKRFKEKAICGEVNLPATTQVELRGNMLYLNDKQICVITSENAHNYFARNNDGKGMERGYLIQQIKQILAQNNEKHQDRWDKIWQDPRCLPYKRTAHQDYWLWNQAFYDADIQELQHIYNLIKD